MGNPAGYLYRVGQSKARRYHRPRVLFPRTEPEPLAEFEPGLPAALEELTESQRQAVILIYVMEWTEQEAADDIHDGRSPGEHGIRPALNQSGQAVPGKGTKASSDGDEEEFLH